MIEPVESSHPTPGQPPPALLAAVQRIMRPLVRGFIRFGLTFPVLSDILKRTYVQIVQEEFRISPDKPASDSRITLLTRVHRKDVRKFRIEDAPPSLRLGDASLTAQIIAGWLGDKARLDRQGKPLALPRVGDDPNSFEALALTTSKDMHPRAILDELLRTGAVTLDAQDQVHLNTNAFLPGKDFEQLAFYYGLGLHDHIAASTYNLSGGPVPFLDRCVHYSGLSQQSVKILQQSSHELGMQTLLALNSKAKQLEAQDQTNANADQRMTFGVYFYHAPDEETERDAND
ncbi:hypothetical protein MNBD_ALPHA06-1244 [hydrothermal vent metagenome]|uniref:Uncharacterized protein n=1 Tax=hydrothermal vent metagenome TaxID=652676 RepID=A0A3B0RER8_9ZZZZ